APAAARPSGVPDAAHRVDQARLAEAVRRETPAHASSSALPPDPAAPSAVPRPRRTLPPGAPLDRVSLGTLVPGSRRSREIPAVNEVSVFEIPLDLDDLEVVEQSEKCGRTSLPSVTRAASAVLPRTPLFSSLDEKSLGTVIERVKLIRLEPDQILFRQGDRGDSLYVVAEGEVAVVAEPTGGIGGVGLAQEGAASDSPVEVARLGEGAFFGEVAILTDQPRTASVMATAHTTVLAIDRDLIGDLIEESPEVLRILLRFLRDRLVDTLVDTSPLFAPFSEGDRHGLAARFLFLEVEKGVVLVEKNKPVPGLFILLCGEATASLGERHLGVLGSGDIFGETSLLGRDCGRLTIRTQTKAFLLELPRLVFNEVIMTHPQVLEYLDCLAEERQRFIEATLEGKTARYQGERLQMV
ncbi:MAG: cyclic nucleotide-binding domain-containing protein, partial [Pseudomonadota bacterium]